MDLGQLRDDLLLVFRILSILGFITMASLTIVVLNEQFKRQFRKEYQKKRWMFIVISMAVALVLMFSYMLLF